MEPRSSNSMWSLNRAASVWTTQRNTVAPYPTPPESGSSVLQDSPPHQTAVISGGVTTGMTSALQHSRPTARNDSVPTLRHEPQWSPNQQRDPVLSSSPPSFPPDNPTPRIPSDLPANPYSFSPQQFPTVPSPTVPFGPSPKMNAPPPNPPDLPQESLIHQSQPPVPNIDALGYPQGPFPCLIPPHPVRTPPATALPIYPLNTQLHPHINMPNDLFSPQISPPRPPSPHTPTHPHPRGALPLNCPHSRPLFPANQSQPQNWPGALPAAPPLPPQLHEPHNPLYPFPKSIHPHKQQENQSPSGNYGRREVSNPSTNPPASVIERHPHPSPIYPGPTEPGASIIPRGAPSQPGDPCPSQGDTHPETDLIPKGAIQSDSHDPNQWKQLASERKRFPIQDPSPSCNLRSRRPRRIPQEPTEGHMKEIISPPRTAPPRPSIPIPNTFTSPPKPDCPFPCQDRSIIHPTTIPSSTSRQSVDAFSDPHLLTSIQSTPFPDAQPTTSPLTSSPQEKHPTAPVDVRSLSIPRNPHSKVNYLWHRLYMIPDPLRSTIAESPVAALIPLTWFEILPNNQYTAAGRDFAATLKTEHPTLLRRFIEADLNLLARDPRLDLLAFREFSRAKYGQRSTGVAQILQVECLGPLLLSLQAYVRHNPNMRAYTLPMPHI